MDVKSQFKVWVESSYREGHFVLKERKKMESRMNLRTRLGIDRGHTDE